ncbi:MAG: hypothetical protein DRJ01_14425 [Bacteroidetes bacterium]|nr:MAG: hypothetical protein DRJ01_14425 [Bacteroidota bacterium]
MLVSSQLILSAVPGGNGYKKNNIPLRRNYYVYKKNNYKYIIIGFFNNWIFRNFLWENTGGKNA